MNSQYFDESDESEYVSWNLSFDQAQNRRTFGYSKQIESQKYNIFSRVVCAAVGDGVAPKIGNDALWVLNRQLRGDWLTMERFITLGPVRSTRWLKEISLRWAFGWYFENKLRQTGWTLRTGYGSGDWRWTRNCRRNTLHFGRQLNVKNLYESNPQTLCVCFVYLCYFRGWSSVATGVTYGI